MLKRFFEVLLGGRPATAPRQPSPEARWRQPPIETIRDEVAPGIVAEISYSTGHHGFVNVVGELSYQDTLRSLPRMFTAKLVPEPDNPHDSNAVAAMTEDQRTIGYLARGVARSYQAKLLQQSHHVTCPAKLTGGEGSKIHIGVVLDFEDVRQALAARGESLASHRDGRGAPPARRDDREYREYLSEEQRRRRGCIARRMQPDFCHGLLGLPLMAVDRAAMDYEAAAEYHRVNNATRQLGEEDPNT